MLMLLLLMLHAAAAAAAGNDSHPSNPLEQELWDSVVAAAGLGGVGLTFQEFISMDDDVAVGASNLSS